MTKLIDIDFKSLKVSTKTFCAKTNLTLNIEKVANLLPIWSIPMGTPKKKIESLGVPEGSIICTNYLGKIRGISFKKKKSKRWFRNSFSVIIWNGKKLLNFKVCRNGTFQITGALNFEDAELCIKRIWEIIRERKEAWTLPSETCEVQGYIVPAMRNVDFTLPIKINREGFNAFIEKTRKNYFCLLETSFGYTGLNVKKKITKPIETLKIKKIWTVRRSSEEWHSGMGTYAEFLELLSEKERKQKLDHSRYNTFLVFHSGKIIQSGLSFDFMKKDFEEFQHIINEAYRLGTIQENLINV
jgi:TATA-box binding protein (TBP) (component of TFIID and TFIIIB)